MTDQPTKAAMRAAEEISRVENNTRRCLNNVLKARIIDEHVGTQELVEVLTKACEIIEDEHGNDQCCSTWRALIAKHGTVE